MRPSVVLILVTVCVVLSSAMSAHPPNPRPRPVIPELLEDRSPLLDVVTYDLDITFLPADQEIQAEAAVELRCSDDLLPEIRLDLVALDVYSVTEDGAAVPFAQEGDELIISPDEAVGQEPRTFLISYGGHPIHEPSAWGGFFFSGGRAYSIGVGLDTTPPWMGRYWFPGHDVPADKALCEITLRVPSDWYGVSNGQLLEDTMEDTVRVMTWGTDLPIATYLMFVAAGPFIEIADDSGPVPIRHYVRASEENAANGSFARVPHMIDTYIDLYGPYPFERFGFVSVPLSGAMEHQTCVAYGSSFINGTLTWESLTAHELSHMWWGDCVTYADWTQIYLSEGFATYSEAIWAEELGGDEAYRQSIYTMMHEYLTSGEDYFPLNEPDVLWGNATYEKGACVVHMLRQTLGDSLFFASLAQYRADHEYGNVTTDSLELSFEAATGMELTWFFDQWVRSPGHPELAFRWASYDYTDGDVGVEIEVSQIQDIGPVFRFPFPVSFVLEDTTVWGSFVDSLPIQVATFKLPGEVNTIHFDPHHDLLFEYGGSQTIDRLQLHSLELADLGDGDGGLDPGEDATLIVGIANDMSGLGAGTLELASLDPDVEVLSGTAAVDSLPAGGVFTNTEEPFSIRAADVPAKRVDMDLTLTTVDDAVITVPVTLQLGIAQRLVVNDDYRENDYEDYFTTALDTLPNGNDREVWRNNLQGPISPARLAKYAEQGMVTWFTGDVDSMALSAEECTTLMEFLDAGGLLFITGQNVVDDLDEHEPGRMFRDNYLHIAVDDPNSSVTKAVEGVEGDYIGNGLAGVIQGDGGANNQTSLTVISPQPGADPVLYYFHQPDMIAASKFENCGKVVLLSFGFEAIHQTQPQFMSRESLIRRVADWLEGPGTGADEQPRSPVLSVTVPEPFTMSSTMTFVLAKELRSRLSLYDMAGRKTHDVFVGILPAGTSRIALPEQPAAGAYVLQATIGEHELSLPVIVVP